MPNSGTQDYVQKAFESIVKQKKNWIGIPGSIDVQPLDGVTMARARNKVRNRMKSEDAINPIMG